MRLDQLGRLGRGKSKHRPRNDPVLYGGPYPFFQTGDVKSANLTLVDFEQTYNELGLRQSKLWERGTLCITIAANIAETAILGIRGCFPDSVVGFVSDSDVSDVRFVKYLLDFTKHKMQAISQGTTQDNLSLGQLLSFDWPVPPLETQRKISAVLGAYDDLIEVNRRRIAVLEEMAQAIYREWFVEYRYPGHDDSRITEDEHGTLPQDWKRVRLGDIATEVRRGTDPTDVSPDTPYVGLEHIPRRSITLRKWGKAADVASRKYRFQEDEVLFGKIRPYFHKVAVAPVDGICSTDTIVLRPLRERHWAILLSAASSEPFVAYATRTSQGTKMPRANWSVLSDYHVALPPDGAVLRRHFEIVRTTVDLTNALVSMNRNLGSTRDLLLPRLVSGDLDVSEADIASAEVPA